MASIYSQIEEIIRKAQDEIIHLEQERMALRREEKNMPRDSYMKEDERLRTHIAAQEQIIRDNQQMLNHFNNARQGIIDLRNLRDLLDRERDPQIRREITEEIDAKEKQVQDSRAHMSEEFQNEMRESIDISEDMVLINPTPGYDNKDAEQDNVSATNTPREEGKDTNVVNENDDEMVLINPTPGYEEVQTSSVVDAYASDIEQARQQYAEAQRQYQASIDKMQEIYRAEQTRFEEGEWADHPRGFDQFVDDYIAKMEVENEKYLHAQAEMRRLDREIKKLEKLQVERVRAEQRSRELQISVEDYQRIVETVSKRSVYVKVLEQQGLGEIVHKRGGRTKAEREAIDAAKEELITRLVEVQKRSETQIDIRETINILYGTDLVVRRGSSNTTTLTEEEIRSIGAQISNRPKQLVKDPNYKPTYTPGRAPSDMPNPYGLTHEDYKMTKEAWDDYIAQGFEPGTEQFNWAVILDGTGTVPKLPQPRPTIAPTMAPTKAPTKAPTMKPTMAPTKAPTKAPTMAPTKEPTKAPTMEPTKEPTKAPTMVPSIVPTIKPTIVPTVVPTKAPTKAPTQQPTVRPTVVPTKAPTKAPKKEPKIGLHQVISKITEGTDVKKNDGKAYRAANIKVAQNFKNELKSGNYLYNIVHLVPAILKVPFQFLSKISGKLRFNKKSKERIATLKENIDTLTEEELMVLYREYRGNRVNGERYPSALNIIIEEKMQEFVMGKVAALNAQIEADYNDVFSVVVQLDQIRAKLSDKSISAKERQQLTEYRQKLLQGRAAQIERIRNNYIETQNWLSGGLNGFGLDMKAATTKLSCVGMRFAKEHDLDKDLEARQTELEKAENRAIADGNDEMALRVFVEAESLMVRETEISNSIFGKRSTGKKYYSPLAEKLDYRDDPFIRDLFTTVAVTSAALQTINAFRGNPAQADIDAANQQLQDAQDLVDKIKGEQGTFKDGMEAQAIQGTTNVTGQVERGALDSTNWGLGTGAYRTADNAGHSFYNQVFNDTQSQISNISSQYASGAITQAQALELMRDLANGTQSTLNNVSQQCLQVFTDYAKTHPQFDLTAVTEGVRYITQHPDAIAQMNNAVVDISSMAGGLTFTQIQALQTLPHDLLVTLVGTASVAALAGNVANTMTENVRKGKYGNNVTEMVEEYAASQDEAREERERSK